MSEGLDAIFGWPEWRGGRDSRRLNGNWLCVAVLGCGLWLLCSGASEAVQMAQSDTVIPLPETPALGSEGGSQEPKRLRGALEELMRDNPVVARVDSEEIRWADVMASAEGLPEQYQSQIEAMFPALLDRLVDLKLLSLAARRQGLAEESSIRATVRAFEDNLIREVYVSRKVTNQITEGQLKTRYAELSRQAENSRLLHAAHILVESEAEARGLIARLDQGEDFAALATAHSLGPSAKRGGDLGYFDPSRMVPAFSEAVQRLGEGNFSHDPVKTSFGWHIIKLIDRQADGIRPYAQIRDDLRKQMTDEALDILIRDLRRSTNIELFPDYSGGAE